MSYVANSKRFYPVHEIPPIGVIFALMLGTICEYEAVEPYCVVYAYLGHEEYIRTLGTFHTRLYAGPRR